MIWILVVLQFAFPALAATKYASLPMVEKVTNAVPIDELIVVAHQRPEFVAPTISVLDHPLYTHLPRVVLTDGASYPLTQPLLDRVTMVQYSKQGELSLNVDVKIVTLIGGSVNDCLKRSGQLLIKEMLDRKNRETLTIRIPSEVVWGWKHEEGGFTLYDSFCKGSPDKFDTRVKEFTEDFMDLFSLTQIYKIRPGRMGEMDYCFVFTRKSDGKQINLILEQLCDIFSKSQTNGT